jgi:two-component system sensor histidine kinase KdpD
MLKPDSENRPDPQALLREYNRENKNRGSLKIFLGYAPGVGKTYKMLEEARILLNKGVKIVVGVVETHKRKETEALLSGLDVLPRKNINYRDIIIPEMDLELIIKTKPTLVLVDELAHSNTPGSKHPKRYQDIEEILENNINVYTTVNIQHFESVNDLIEQITCVRVSETLPDLFLDKADEIEIIDIPIEHLQERLKEGKVYIGDQATRAIENFFNRTNLTALREIALRRVANKLDDELVDHMKARAINMPWATSERLLVSVASSPYASSLVRRTYQMANDLNAEWIALYVEVAPRQNLSLKDRTYLTDALQLSEELGARIIMTSGTDIATEMVKVANQEKITKVVMGKPRGSYISRVLRKSPAYKILDENNNFDIYFVTPLTTKEQTLLPLEDRKANFNSIPYLYSFSTIVPVFLVGLFLFHILNIKSFETFFILSPIVTAMLWGTGPSLFISIINILVYDFFFVEPIYTFTISRVEYIFDLIIFFVTSIIIGQLSKLIKHQQEALKLRLEQVKLLEEMSRELLKVSIAEHIAEPNPKRGTQILRNNIVKTKAIEQITEISIRYLNRAVNLPILVFFKDEKDELKIWGKSSSEVNFNTNDHAVAYWVYSHNEKAGKGTSTLTGTNYFFLPITLNEQEPMGVIGICSDYKQMLPNERYLTFSIIKLIAEASEQYISLQY